MSTLMRNIPLMFSVSQCRLHPQYIYQCDSPRVSQSDRRKLYRSDNDTDTDSLSPNYISIFESWKLQSSFASVFVIRRLFVNWRYYFYNFFWILSLTRLAESRMRITDSLIKNMAFFSLNFRRKKGLKLKNSSKYIFD